MKTQGGKSSLTVPSVEWGGTKMDACTYLKLERNLAMIKKD